MNTPDSNAVFNSKYFCGGRNVANESTTNLESFSSLVFTSTSDQSFTTPSVNSGPLYSVFFLAKEFKFSIFTFCLDAFGPILSAKKRIKKIRQQCFLIESKYMQNV